MVAEVKSRIDEIRERWAAATPGPWRHGPESHGVYKPSVNHSEKPIVDEAATQADARAIAHAPDDIAYLLELLEVVKPHLYWLGEACQRANCSSPSDEIMAARAALLRLQEAL